MTVDILICTIDKGIENVRNVLMPETEGINYIISWQHSNNSYTYSAKLPKELIRDDVKIYDLYSKGLSKNRNNCILHATSDICLIADDDISYHKEGIQRLINYYESHKDIDMITYEFETDGIGKNYPVSPCRLIERPNNFNISSIEISFRREKIQGIISFNELMGLGAPKAGAGEDDLFILDCLQHKLNCWFLPIVVASHKGETTGRAHGGDTKVIFSKGILIRIFHPKTYPLWYIWMARSIKINHNVSFFHALITLYQAGIYARKHKILHYNINDIYKHK